MYMKKNKEVRNEEITFTNSDTTYFNWSIRL